MLTITLLVVLFSLIWYFINRAANANKYWDRKGLKSLKPRLFFGNTLPVLLNKKHLCEVYQDVVKEFPDEPLVGFYETNHTRLLVLDPEYIEKVMIKDFSHFPDHGMGGPDEKTQSIDSFQLFSMRGSKWRALRYKLTPLFTSGKLKLMYEGLEICGEKLIKYLEKNSQKEVVFSNVLQWFTMDVVGLSVFGFDAGVLDNPNSEFGKYGTNVFNTGYFNTFILNNVPWLAKMLKLSHNNKGAVKYFCKILGDALNYRKENNVYRNDFIQMMIQLKEKGSVEVPNWDSNDEYLKSDKAPAESVEITDEKLMAIAYTFMTTGIDGISLGITHVLYELSLNEEHQCKVREEIMQKVAVHKGLSYDALRSMSYLDNVISESLRLHPTPHAIFRVCVKDYTFPNGYLIKRGENLHIPIHAIHLNPSYHSDPLVFKPERFEYPMRPGTYFPFGDGPRICIAMRFALLQVKYGVAKILMNYKVKLNPKTDVPFKLKPHSVVVSSDKPFYFDIKKI